ncbi:cytochrome c oxidase subunit 3 [Peijinzhouia sedimentorum]
MKGADVEENTSSLSRWQKVEKMHPHKMLIILSVVGSSLIFFFMILAFTLSMLEADRFNTIAFPKSFIVSAFTILLSSFMLARAMPAYLNDDLQEVKRSLAYTLILGLAFAASQFIGWQELDLAGIGFVGERSGAYIYVISGLHLVHLVGGLFFLSFLYVKVARKQSDPVASLIYLTTPYEKIRLEMLSIWWHFMDVLWLILFFYFLFTF